MYVRKKRRSEVGGDLISATIRTEDFKEKQFGSTETSLGLRKARGHVATGKNEEGMDAPEAGQVY